MFGFFKLSLLWIPLLFGACSDLRSTSIPTPHEQRHVNEISYQLNAIVELNSGTEETLRIAAFPNGIFAFLGQNDFFTNSQQQVSKYNFPKCITQTAQTTTFTDCHLDGFMFDGGSTREDGIVQAEIDTVFVGQGNIQQASSVEARITVENSVLNGTISVDAMNETEQGEMRINAKLQVENLELDQGLPVSGTLTISGTLFTKRGETVFPSRTLWLGQ